jgi:hypothetical protein
MFTTWKYEIKEQLKILKFRYRIWQSANTTISNFAKNVKFLKLPNIYNEFYEIGKNHRKGQ